MGYDTVSYEVCITDVLPEGGAIAGGMGPVQNRADFERYPWDELPARYWAYAAPKFDTFARGMPRGVKALGGVGSGILGISENLVGVESLAKLFAEDPDIVAALYCRTGDLMVRVWSEFLARYGDNFAICRLGDTLGDRDSVFLSPEFIREQVLPQYRRVIDVIKLEGRPVLWRACGPMCSLTDEMIALGIGAQHSDEDCPGPFDGAIAAMGIESDCWAALTSICCARRPRTRSPRPSTRKAWAIAGPRLATRSVPAGPFPTTSQSTATWL